MTDGLEIAAADAAQQIFSKKELHKNFVKKLINLLLGLKNKM